MERNRWETAIRCLEVALHPNTTDDEVIAGVNGFRRTANGTPLRDMCGELGGGGYDDRAPGESPAGLGEALDRLSRENLNLRRRLEIEETSQITTVSRLQEVERRARDLDDDLLAAQRRANSAEQLLAELRSSLDDLSGENRDLRRALEQARPSAPERPAPQAVAPFQNLLAAAHLRAGQADAVTRHPTAPERRRESGGAPIFHPASRANWTA